MPEAPKGKDRERRPDLQPETVLDSEVAIVY